MKLKLEEEVSGFTERDYESKAILNTDVESLLAYKLQKQKQIEKMDQTEEINTLKSQVTEIKQDVTEIRLMLKQLLKVTE